MLFRSVDLSYFENVYFTNHYDPADTNPLVVHFVTEYQADYNGETPNALAALSYDTLFMVAAAIEKAGTTEVAALRDALADQSVVYECVTGTFSLDETGTPSKGAAIIAFTVDGGSVVTKLDSIVTSLD